MINVTKTTLPPLEKYTKYLEKIWQNNQVTNKGEFSIKLEKELEDFLKVKNLLVLSNGTTAMQLAFKALDLTGEVITTPFTFPATTNALIWEGLTPVFADIDSDTFNIDPKSIEKKITPKTTAILAVHVFGNPCDVEAIEEIANENNLKVIYDSAHAFGVEYKGKSVLEWGDANTLSFHAAKTFHTVEGGAVIAKDKQVYKKIDLLRNHGIETYDVVILPGLNVKMNELQAAMGLCLLPSYNDEVNMRKTIYDRYSSAFSNNSKFKLQTVSCSRYTYPYFPVCFESGQVRDKVYEALLKNDIRARKYFYPPCNEFPFIKTSSTDLLNSTQISHSILCLPLYATLDKKNVEKIIDLVNSSSS